MTHSAIPANPQRPPLAERLEARLHFAAGDLDTLFGDPSDPGKARVVIQQRAIPDETRSMAVLPDGKILVTGLTGTKEITGTQFGVARLDANGLLDPTFGSGGTAVFSFGGPEAAVNAVLSGPDGRPVVLDDGGIIVGGYANAAPDFVHFALAKLDTNGALDPSFGGGTGRVITLFNANVHSYIHKLLLQGNSILAVGTAGRTLAMARYSLSGVIDTTFGSDGTGTTHGPTGGHGKSVGLLPDGRIVLAGTRLDNNVLFELYDANGAFVSTATSQLLAGVNGMAVLPDGKLLVAGPSRPAPARLDTDLAVARFNPDFTPDLTFGGGDGVATLDVGGAQNDEAAALIRLNGSDGFLVAGSTNIHADTAGNLVGSDFAVARFLPDGTPDASFGGDGAVAQPFALTDFGSLQTVSAGKALAMQPDGNILVAGTVPDRTLQPLPGGERGVVNRFGVARFVGAGSAIGTGSISGKFFLDADRSGIEESGESPLPGMIAYFDRNDNGRNDADEPQAVAGPDGRYILADLPAGRYYRIRAVRGAFTQTHPGDVDFYDITLADGQPFSGADFGQVGPANDAAPKAGNDSATTQAGKSANLDVLANDTDDRGLAPATITLTTQPAHGSAQVDPTDARIVYTAAQGYQGTDRFKYIVHDTAGNASRAATVTVAVVGQGALAAAVVSAPPPEVVATTKLKARMSVVVTNPTDHIIAGRVSVALFLSGNDAVDEFDPQLASVAKTLRLKAGAFKTVKVTVREFPLVGDGTYHVVAKVTAPDGSQATAEAPSTVNVAAPFVDLNSLFSRDVVGTVRAGRKLPLRIVVENRGNVPAQGAVSIALFGVPDATPGAVGVPIATLPIKLKIKPGANRRYNLAALLPSDFPAGAYGVRATLSVVDLPGDPILSEETFDGVGTFVVPAPG